jgi:hypothetical protein
MKDQAKIAKAGKMICVDSGEYSNYSITGFFVVLKDFNPMAELKEYKAANPDECKPYSFNDSKFLAQILTKGLLLEIEYGTLYMGAREEFDGVNFTPSREG